MNPLILYLAQYLSPIIILLIAYYFCIFVPIKEASKEKNLLLTSLKVGDKIVTKDGIVGVIAYKLNKNIVIMSFNQTLIEIEVESVFKRI